MLLRRLNTRVDHEGEVGIKSVLWITVWHHILWDGFSHTTLTQIINSFFLLVPLHFLLSSFQMFLKMPFSADDLCKQLGPRSNGFNPDQTVTVKACHEKLLSMQRVICKIYVKI